MGIHSRNRPRGRTIAKGALALGATLTGFGLTAAAFDSGGVAQAESSGMPGLSGMSQYGYSDSGLGAPVAIADVMATPTPSVGLLAGGAAPTRSESTSRTSDSATQTRPRHAATTPVKTASSTSTIKTAPPVLVAAEPEPQTRSGKPTTPTTTTTTTTTSTNPTNPSGGSAPTKTTPPKTPPPSTTTPPTKTSPPTKASPPTHSSPPASSDLPLVSDLSALGSLLGKLPIVGSLLGLL